MKRLPDTLVLIGGILLMVMLLSWVVPAGSYQRKEVNGRSLVDPDTFERMDRSPRTPWHVLQAPLKGFEAAADVIGFIFLIGGAFKVVTATGAIQAGLMRLVALGGRQPRFKKCLIPGLMILFSLGGATFGMAEETLVFVLVTIPMARAMGHDAIVGMSIPVIGAFVGFAGAFANPFTVGIGHGIAQLPMFSGIGYRLVVWTVFTALGIFHVMRYAAKEAGELPGPAMDAAEGGESVRGRGVEGGESLGKIAGMDPAENDWTARRLTVLGVVGMTLVLLILGAVRWEWYITEMAALFLSMGLVSAMVGGLGVQSAVAAFYHGAREMTPAAVLIGFARGVPLLAEEGQIIDTLLHAMASIGGELPAVVSVQFMFLGQSVLNFFVPSGSGQAGLTLPVMVPLSDLLGITRQTCVLAFQLGDGISNLIIPTSGLLMALLGVCGIPFGRWARYIWPLVLILTVTGMLLLVPPVLFNWQ